MSGSGRLRAGHVFDYSGPMTRERPSTGLPVEDALPALLTALAEAGRAVLVAPPGAGKTTLVPLALLDETVGAGRILMLEPRRLAARAAAERMAALRGEAVGQTVGYRVRGDAKIGPETRIEVLTEGILTRMIQDDPALDGVSAVIFDEFHERSLAADLGLALAWEARGALREDLRIVVMSATLDAEPVAALMDGAPVIRSEGRAFPIETLRLEKPWKSARRARLEDAVAALIRRAHDEAAGDILAFLPGAGEIRRVAASLGGLETSTDIRPLYGAMSFRDQRAALAAAPPGRRKVVLATSIAETSLTVEGVRIVVDGGLARRARFDPGAGMSRLVTEAASKAEADQRRGRAGREDPGSCYRLWTVGEEGAMAPFAPPEIVVADLSPLALELAAWGAAPEELAFLDLPPEGALAAARALLRELGALDRTGGLTDHGRALARAPTHPRLAHMILTAPEAERGGACALAALIEARRGPPGVDIAARLKAVAGPDGDHTLRKEAERLAKRMGATASFRVPDPGALIARAFPDRIALRRKGGEPRFLLSGGKGAKLRPDDPLAGEPMLAVADLDGDGTEAVIRLAAPVSRAAIETLFADRLAWEEVCVWSRRERRVAARRRLRLGALALEGRRWRDAPPDKIAAALADGVRDLGLDALPWTKPARRLQARVEWARGRGADAPAMDDAALTETLDDWLTPYLIGMKTAEDLAALDLARLLRDRAGHAAMQAVERTAPEAIEAPTGTTCRIDYGGAQPSVAVRLQELYGLDAHPMAGGEPLLLELLSPAGRPVQTTADLPGFWRSSYADVRKDMRGRYPRHPWPEDPLEAAPTRRVKGSS